MGMEWVFHSLVVSQKLLFGGGLLILINPSNPIHLNTILALNTWIQIQDLLVLEKKLFPSCTLQALGIHTLFEPLCEWHYSSIVHFATQQSVLKTGRQGRKWMFSESQLVLPCSSTSWLAFETCIFSAKLAIKVLGKSQLA